jgi:hypothetical protein
VRCVLEPRGEAHTQRMMIFERAMPADGMSAAAETGTSARPAGSSRTNPRSVHATYSSARLIERAEAPRAGSVANVAQYPALETIDVDRKDLPAAPAAA